ncbi:CoA pyrophosphatase [Thalassotalea sediminis]|uniref:CoA pyrophosphatase n=1 Tax=Thalassotalea sediminis TaxID=1759089 RepID=UPI0025731FF2|nr:CoA pyrophosphatase [Thalassotalea sediminis]
MDRKEFLNKFHLHQLSSNDVYHDFIAKSKVRQSAVLVALVELNNNLQVILTKRSEHLRHHPGQISFPGGKVEAQDRNVIDTALREANEEIGISADNIEILGQLPDYQTLTGFTISPIIALLSEMPHYIIDNNEVAHVFEVPLAHFLDQNNHIIVDIERHSRKHPVYYMPYHEHNIWGATAAILKDLCQHLR